MSALEKALSLLLVLPMGTLSSILTFLVLVPTLVWATPLCDLTMVSLTEKKVIVQQCRGTCYLESYTSALETHLSNKLQKPLSVSRLNTFAEQMWFRGRKYLLEQMTPPEAPTSEKAQADQKTQAKASDETIPKPTRAPPERVRSIGGYYDVISGGTGKGMTHLERSVGAIIMPRKTELQTYQETEEIHKLDNAAASLLYEFNVERKKIIQESKPSALQNELERLSRTYLGRLRTIVNPYLSLDYYKNLQAQEVDLKDIKLTDLTADHVESITLPGGSKIDVPRTTEIIEVDANGEPHFSSYIEGQIRSSIAKQEELLLSYFHFRSMPNWPAEHAGVFDVPPGYEPVPRDQWLMTKNKKHKLGGFHAVALVGYLLDKEGRIEFLKVRNSHGLGFGNDMGHDYISVRYLQHYFSGLNRIESGAQNE